MKVGDAEIVALSDMNCAYPTAMGELWPNVPVDDWRQYKERYPDTFDGDKMRLEIGCYLVRSQGRTILIDTGYGPGPIDYIGGLRGELMADLARQKIEPTEVDTVFLSHLHLDHVGWNTIDQGGKFVPTFPNARYIAHQADLDHFRKPEVRDASRYPYLDQCVEPLVELGIFDTISQDSDLTSEVRAIHTPGHTPGHMSVMVSSSGQRALIQGDVLIHPAQVTETGWSPLFDGDFELATDTRRKLLDQVETDGTTVISCHFPAPGFGKVVRQEGKRYWQVGV
jgi:glyoxylase-like metal-dependent hydrolase (beta-lactamase superfamily II)